MTTMSCRCCRCDQKQAVELPPKSDMARFLMAYHCQLCGERQVRLDLPSEHERITLDDIQAVTP